MSIQHLSSVTHVPARCYSFTQVQRAQNIVRTCRVVKMEDGAHSEHVLT
jgi:hypothetical protein